MRGPINRALMVVAGFAVILTAALPWSARAASSDKDVTSITAPQSRFADSFALDRPVLLPFPSSGPVDLSRFSTNEVASELYLFDGVSIQTGFNTDVARVLDRYVSASNGYDGLFYSTAALDSPYTSLSSGGSYVGLSMALAKGLHLAWGWASTSPGLNPYLLNSRLAVGSLGGAGLPYDGRSTHSALAGFSWNFAKWGGIGFTTSQTTERDGALGMNNLEINTARTTALGVSARVGFGGGWVTTASYSEGMTQLDLKPGALAAATEAGLHTQSYGIAVAKHGLFGNDALGVAFARPAAGYGANFAATSDSNDMQFFGRDKLFAGMAPETDIELGYITSWNQGSFALQTNASYQMNYGGLNGNNAISLLSRAKIKF
jgi:hypothetical protein